MKSICIGIHVHSNPERLARTIESLRTNTAPSYELILLPDGSDDETTSALRALKDISQLATEDARGTAACFNRLATAVDAEVLVLLESGSLVGPGWLDRLLTALDADPRNGLAGPSTNLCWNQQCIYPQAASTADEISFLSMESFTRFGSETRTLEPLHSLADFCYVVRREVIETLGAADEGYGLGPCWEMDYNIRAARAGFHAVWAAAAYVHRLPFTTRRSHEEAKRFEASKRRYQDKFCGARLRGEKSDYRSHCRGDECPNFAPANLIQIRDALRPDPDKGVEVAAAIVSDPLVTCIMPTHNRRSFVTQSIRTFFRQQYANRELLIIDDGTDNIAECVPQDDRVRYLRLDSRMNVGAKRNLACREARGEIIVHWDDDDWYPPTRLEAQVRGLANGADICGTSSLFFFDPANNRAFEYKYTDSNRRWVGGSTLAYRRDFWERNNFPEIQVGEDSQFVWSERTRQVCDLTDSTLCVAMIHADNTSRKETVGPYWTSINVDRLCQLLGDEINFYRAMRDAPLVSAIMPTCNRRSFVRLALERFALQDYANKELVIVDDGDDPVADIASNLAAVKYIHLPTRATIGAKRNLACQHASGEIIAHWDDDDWYATDRLRYQAAPIVAGEADITGLENAFVLELPAGQFWTTQPRLHQQMFFGNVHGGTLVFRKSLWSEGARYPEIDLAEDAWLLHSALNSGNRLRRLSNPAVFAYVRHGGNAWKECAPGRFINPNGWEKIDRPSNIPLKTIESYCAAARDGSKSSSAASVSPA